MSSGLLAASLGIIEFCAHIFNVTSPTMALRNSASLPVDTVAMLNSGLSRVSSVAVESSILSQFLLTVLPLTVPAIIGKGYVISRFFDRLAFLVIVFVLLITTSSTAYVILLISPVLCFPVITRLGVKITRALWTAAACLVMLLALGAVLYFFTATGNALVNEVLLSKGSGYSALERAMTISYALGYFRQYPLLGVGWGSITSHDLIAMILGSSGIIGLAAFVFMVARVGSPLYRRISSSPKERISQSCAIWFMSGILLLAASVISEFPFVFGHMWFVLAMCIASSLVSERHAVIPELSRLDSGRV
jgi:hypothetical protein